MATLAGFSRTIQLTANRIPVRGAELQRKVALAVNETAASATPVDTGKARSNWQLGVGAAKTSVLEPFAAGMHLGISETANLNAVRAQALSEIRGHQQGQDLHSTNNVPYIGILNEGHSKQAPANFVERAVLAGITASFGARLVI